jgi:hypothetical protein
MTPEMVYIEMSAAGTVLVDNDLMVAAGQPPVAYATVEGAAWAVARQWPHVRRAWIVADGDTSQDHLLAAFDAAYRDARYAIELAERIARAPRDKRSGRPLFVRK